LPDTPTDPGWKFSGSDVVASFQLSAGDGLVWPASQLNFDGMLSPPVNAGLEIDRAAAATMTSTRSPPNCRRAMWYGTRSEAVPRGRA